MSALFQIYVIALLLALFPQFAYSGNTCTGIAPPATYASTTPGMDFTSCNSVCGLTTVRADTTLPPWGGVPAAWKWKTIKNAIPTWDMAALLNYPDILQSSVSSQNGSPPTYPAAYLAPWLCSSNMEYIYDRFPGPNSLIGVAPVEGGTSHSDIWLKTNKRIIHIGGGEQVKCDLNSDGVNEPFIFVANNQIVLGWVLATPMAWNGDVMSYDVSYNTYPLLKGEVPKSFNVSSYSDSGAKWCNTLLYRPLSSPFMDSGFRVRGKHKTYSIAAEAATYPSSPMRIFKNNKLLGLVLVDLDDPSATPVHFNTVDGVKALRSYP